LIKAVDDTLINVMKLDGEFAFEYIKLKWAEVIEGIDGWLSRYFEKIFKSAEEVYSDLLKLEADDEMKADYIIFKHPDIQKNDKQIIDILFDNPDIKYRGIVTYVDKTNLAGSDADKHILVLNSLYTNVESMLLQLGEIINTANDGGITLLLDTVRANGGGNIQPAVLQTVSFDEYVTTARESGAVIDVNLEGIVTASNTFDSFNTAFSSFASTLNTDTEVLLNNWVEGAGRSDFSSILNDFNEVVAEQYKNQINEIQSDLAIVLRNLKKVDEQGD